MHSKFLLVTLIIFVSKVCAKSDKNLSELYKGINVIKECMGMQFPSVCFKEKALDALNMTVMSEEPLNLGYVRIEKNPAYQWNHTNDDDLPEDIRERSLKLSNILFDMFEKFFKSRTIRLDVDDAFEGRKKMGAGKKGMMMVMAAVAGMGAGMMMGKMGMMAAGALMMAKLALALCALMLLKKVSGGGGGGGDEAKEVKIVYATTGGSDYGKGGGGGGGGGGWHRSLNQDPQNIAYRAYAPQDNNVSGGY